MLKLGWLHKVEVKGPGDLFSPRFVFLSGNPYVTTQKQNIFYSLVSACKETASHILSFLSPNNAVGMQSSFSLGIKSH